MSDRIGTVRAVSFSPTGSTRRVLRSIAAGIGAARVQEDSLDRPAWREAGVQVGADELLLVGMPVYAGRVPGLFHGGLPVRGTGDAVCVVSYGNRAYEDALSELVGLTRRAGFRVVAARSVRDRTFAERADRRRASRRGRYGPYGGVRPDRSPPSCATGPHAKFRSGSRDTSLTRLTLRFRWFRSSIRSAASVAAAARWCVPCRRSIRETIA